MIIGRYCVAVVHTRHTMLNETENEALLHKKYTPHNPSAKYDVYYMT